jgi:hypothetical protein
MAAAQACDSLNVSNQRRPNSERTECGPSSKCVFTKRSQKIKELQNRMTSHAAFSPSIGHGPHNRGQTKSLTLDVPIFFKAADSRRPALTSGDFEWCILTVLLPIERAWQARE